MSSHRVTVVTAFYEIPSKFKPAIYWEWIQNFSRLKCDIIIFTSPDLIDKFRNMFPSAHIISIPFQQLHHYQYIDKYREHNKIDWNKEHTPELYIIWAEKLKFVKRAIELNPYSTDKFIWCDIGAIRDNISPEILQNFPLYDKIVPNKMNFLMLGPIYQEDIIPDKYGIVGKRYEDRRNRLGGGIHGGTIDAWEKYEKLWDSTIERYFNAGRFAGQDQCIMFTIFLENQDLFHMIRAKIYRGDLWFYLLYYWSVRES